MTGCTILITDTNWAVLRKVRHDGTEVIGFLKRIKGKKMTVIDIIDGFNNWWQSNYATATDEIDTNWPNGFWTTLPKLNTPNDIIDAIETEIAIFNEEDGMLCSYADCVIHVIVGGTKGVIVTEI